MWDKFGRIAWNPFHLQTLRETFHTVNPCDPVSTTGWFLPCGFVNKFLIWGRKNGGCTDIFRSCAYQDWVCHVGVTMIRWSIFSCRIFLKPDLSSWVGGKQNYTPCPKDEGMHLLLYCLGLVYMQFIKEVGGWLWMQTDTELVVSCLLQSLWKLKHLVSILNYPWHFVIPSLHVHLEHWEGTPQALRFVCWEGNSK